MEKSHIVLGLIGLVFVAILAFLLPGSPDPEPAPVVEQPVPVPVPEIRTITEPPAPPEPPVPPPAAEPVVVEAPEPVTPESPAVEPVVLPSLNNSDRFVRDEITGMDNGSPLLNLMSSQEIVRKFVTATENVSRGFYPTQNLPLNMLDSPVVVQSIGEDRYLLSPASYDRYTPLVNAVVNMEATQGVQLYRKIMPLVNRAFGELGLPNRDFDQVLLSAIDNIINARTAEGPYELIRPNVNYKFADPAIENLREVEKLLLRMGPDNASRLKAKLVILRRQLVTRN
jgi:hypothetical protein